ncbi:MAG: hypothetical protein IJS62_03850 [Bacteroidales bacterium]|nr:hypothetical protein [Bacteroidales bacterium]
MTLFQPATLRREPFVVNEETMLSLIHDIGIIPFFENIIPGWSVEEHTPPEFFFGDDGQLGPWDWKIACVQSGDIAYGKFLLGGKAAFATAEVYRELMNWRRSLPKYRPDERQQRILDFMEEHGSAGIKDVRNLFSIKKGAADALMAGLQRQTRVVTGDITRVYRGPDLHYNGWQTSSFCTPEALFEDDAAFPFPGWRPRSMKSDLTPAQSREFLVSLILKQAPGTPVKIIDKMLG